jgi:alpha-L-fucosidase
MERTRREFAALKFGMFIHFGLYSQGQDHEWHMYLRKMSRDAYKTQFLRSFDPDPAGMEQWVLTVKAMGAKYLVCTSKHCDGFCLWPTAHHHALDPEYRIENTLFWDHHQKGVLDYLFEAGRKHNIKIGLYHSVVDWSWSKKRWRRPPEHAINDIKLEQTYRANLEARLVELIDRYPDILLLWLDAFPLIRDGLNRLHYRDLYATLRAKKADLLIGYNPGRTTFQEDPDPCPVDFHIFENMAHRSEKNPVPYPRPSKLGELPAEVCLTINDHWGYNATDKHYKSPEFIADLVQLNAARYGNTLLNFGPMPNGFISEEQVTIAHQIGDVLQGRK